MNLTTTTALTSVHTLSLALSLCTLVACGKSESAPSPQGGAVRSASADAPSKKEAPSESVKRALASPKLRLEVAESAYNTLLHSDGDALYIITPHRISRLQGDGPGEHRVISLGSAMTVDHDQIVYYEDGALRRVSLGGGSSTVIRKQKAPTERLAHTAGGTFTLERTASGGSQLGILEGGNLRVLYESPTPIAALAAKESRAYFVESSDGGFRLGSVTMSGEKVFGPPHPGRTPSFLFVSDAVYYYDGPKGEVRGSTFNLDAEDVVARDVVCSPLHMSDQLYCASPGGVAVLSPGGSSKRELPVGAKGPITALTLHQNQLFWIEDAGADRLIVKSLPLD